MKRREVACLALLTFLPQVLGGRARLNADTKQYLYLDPLDLLARSTSVWDSRVGGGAVTHQAIGYLWPMGPYYALMEALGVPDWVAQRLWVGGLQFAAALGALALLRRLLPATWLHLPAALAYGLSPFVLGHVTGQSGLLVPFAGLPWLVLVMAKATDAPRAWRWPALFALVVTTCGSLNGSSVFFVVLAAALWVPFAVWEHVTATTRDGLRVLLRAGVLTLLTQLWWLTAYAVGGAYNLPILQLTENVDTTNATTSAPEVLRGLGYWFFYGRDTEGPWLGNLSTPYLTSGWLLVTSFAIPIVALLAGAVVRWRYRTYFTMLVALGTVLAVGAYPRSDPSLAGEAFATLSRQSDLVLSLRNTQRAAALLALGLAGLLAAGLEALRRRDTRMATGAGVVVVGLVALALPAQWRTGLIAERFSRPDDLPAWWTDAADELDRSEGRVLELPGIDFASYRWGHTLDPVSVGLTDRPIVARELVPLGGAAGADLLAALDRSMQEGWFEPDALAPVARLLGATDVLVRNDLEYERYRTVRPHDLWPRVLDAAGLGAPRPFGEGYENNAGPERPMIDELELGLDPDAPAAPAVAILDVLRPPRPLLDTEAVGGGVVLDGDGEGVVSAAAAGLLGDLRGPLLFGADVMAAGDLREVTDGSTSFVITDTYRKRANRWYSLRENVGATEPADMGVVDDDPSDARLSLADETPGTRTVVDWRGVKRIWASNYGSQLTLVPEERPSNAFDGDPSTAWRASPLDDDTPRHISIELDDPVAAESIRLLPPVGRPGTTLPTRIAVTLDGDRRSVIDLDPDELRSPDGAEVILDGDPFQRLDVELVATEVPGDPAGFAEIGIPGVTMEEVVVLPTAVLDELGATAADVPVTLLLTRQRANPAEPVRADPEPYLLRSFDVPVALRTTLDGTVRIDPRAPEPVLDELLGAGPSAWPVRVTTTERLAGDLDARGSSVLDGHPDTAWQTPLVGVEGQRLTIELDDPVTLTDLDLDLVTDGRHSLPRRIQLRVDGGAPVDVELPTVDASSPSGRTPVSVALPAPLTGTRWEATIADIAETTTTDWYTGRPVVLPVGIAELAMPGVPLRPGVDTVDVGCRDDLVELAGQPLPVRITGATTEGAALELKACEGGVELPAGRSELRTQPGRETGLAIDRLAFSSPGGGAVAGSSSVATVTDFDEERPGKVTGTVETDGEPFWLRLDQSINDGWELEVDGATVEGPRPLDAYANGWLVRPDGAGTLKVTASWAPQRAVDIGLLVSAFGVVVCLVLLLHRRPGRRDVTEPAVIDAAPERPAWWCVALGAGLAGLLIDPLAIPLAVAVLIAARWRPWIGRLAPAVLVGGAAVGVVLLQRRHRYGATFDWPTLFPWVHQAALLGVVVLLATSLPRAVRRKPDSVQQS